MRLIVARCEITYSGRLSTFLPMACAWAPGDDKADGSVQVHSDGGGSKAKPQNWMTPPTAIEIEEIRRERSKVRKLNGSELLDGGNRRGLADISHEADLAIPLEKDGVERDLQELLAERPVHCGEGFRLVRREWPTDIGPVDLMCRDDADGWIAVEIKAHRHDRGGGAAGSLPRANPHRSRDGGLPGGPRGPDDQAPSPHPRRRAWHRLRRGLARRAARYARA